MDRLHHLPDLGLHCLFGDVQLLVTPEGRADHQANAVDVEDPEAFEAGRETVDRIFIALRVLEVLPAVAIDRHVCVLCDRRTGDIGHEIVEAGPEGRLDQVVAAELLRVVDHIEPNAGAIPRVDGALPRDLTPTLAGARQDDDPLRDDGCGLSLAGSKPPACVYGKKAGTVTVALVGDSHAAHWFPAIELLARQRGWRLVPLTKFSCVFVDMRIWSPRLKREYTECEEWRERVVGRLVALRPDLVIVVSDQELPVVVETDDDPELQGAAVARLIKRVPGKVAIIVDTPRSDHDVPACLTQHRKAIERCTTTRSAAFGWRHMRRENEAARLSGATLVDLSGVGARPIHARRSSGPCSSTVTITI